ncbi:hypothetical protein Tco_0330823 [Tanacetum coccineum]
MYMILYTYTNKTSVSVSQVETSTSQTSNTSVEMPKDESVRPSGVIIEDWVSDDEDIFQSNDLQATNKPNFKRIEFTNARNESVKPKQVEKPSIITQNPKNQTNKNASPQEANSDTGLKKSVDARQSKGKNVSTQQYIMFPLWSSISSSYKSSNEKYKNDTADDAAGKTPVQKPAV